MVKEMMCFIGIILAVHLCTAAAIHQGYSQFVDSQNLTAFESGSSGIPSIFFRQTRSPLLHQDQVKVEYGMKNVPSVLINDRRIRVGLWVCSYSLLACTDDEHFDLVHQIVSKPNNETTTTVAGYFRHSPFDLTITQKGRYRLRLVMEITDPHTPMEPKPSSAIRQFMDEVTVFKENFEMPTMDVWWNDKVSASDIGVQYFSTVQLALNNAFQQKSALTEYELSIPGMSGPQFRHFYNNLGALLPGDIHYLEIGIYAGSTMVSLLSGNGGKVRTVVGVDYWDDFAGFDGHGAKGSEFAGMGGVKVQFDSLLPKYTTSDQNVYIMHADCWTVSPQTLLKHSKGQKFNLYLFDGPHAIGDHFFAVVNFLPVLADTFILVVDDWNWDEVRAGTESGLAAVSSQFVVLGKIELLTGDHPPEGVEYPWHNGMAVFVVQKLASLSAVSVSAVI